MKAQGDQCQGIEIRHLHPSVETPEHLGGYHDRQQRTNPPWDLGGRSAGHRRDEEYLRWWEIHLPPSWVVHHSKCVTPVQTSLHRRSILHLKNTETLSKVSRRLTKNSQQQFSWSQSWWNNNVSLIWRASAPLVVLFPLRKLPHPLTVNITSAGSGPYQILK